MWDQLKRRSSYQALPITEPKRDIYRDLHHPVFQNIRVVQVRLKMNLLLLCQDDLLIFTI